MRRSNKRAPAVRDVPRCETLPDLLQTLLRLRGAADARQNFQCLLVAALDHEPPRTFRNERQQQQIQQRRKHLYAEHPAPVVLAHVEQEVVREERGRDADHDHELVERHESAAPLRGRDLRDVDRRDQYRRADREPAHDARGHESRERRRERRQQRRQHEQRGRAQQYLSASKSIAEHARECVACERTPAQGADRPAEPEIAAGAAESEVLANERHDAGDHRRVESQQQAADRSGERHEADVQSALPHARSARFVVRHRVVLGHTRLPAPGERATRQIVSAYIFRHKNRNSGIRGHSRERSRT